MRDDLHRTVPLPPSWKRVLKLALSPADADRAQIAMSRAINTEFINEVGRTWLANFRGALAFEAADLFANDKVFHVLESFGRKSPTVLQRKLIENVYGMLARGVDAASLFDRSVDAACHQLADSRVAQTSSLIAAVANDRETFVATKRLTEVAESCEFSVTRTKQKALTGDDAMDLIITCDGLGPK